MVTSPCTHYLQGALLLDSDFEKKRKQPADTGKTTFSVLLSFMRRQIFTTSKAM